MNKISLVMATLGRVEEIELFIKSLKIQTFNNYELIIVDQNKHYQVKHIYDKYKDEVTIKYIRSSEIGLSKNRNIGIQNAEGNIIAFPDDDCEYEYDTLNKVNEYFVDDEHRNIYSCKVIDKLTKEKFGKSSDKNEKINLNNIMKNCVSISVFIKYKDKKDIKFDEMLGVGTYFGSGEESDLIFSLIHKGYKGDYYCNDVVYHPAREKNNIDIDKNNRDSLGLGALMKKEIHQRRNYKMLPFFISRLVRPIIGSIIYPRKAKIYLASIKYRMKGYLEYNG